MATILYNTNRSRRLASEPHKRENTRKSTSAYSEALHQQRNKNDKKVPLPSSVVARYPPISHATFSSTPLSTSSWRTLVVWWRNMASSAEVPTASSRAYTKTPHEKKNAKTQGGIVSVQCHRCVTIDGRPRPSTVCFRYKTTVVEEDRSVASDRFFDALSKDVHPLLPASDALFRLFHPHKEKKTARANGAKTKQKCSPSLAPAWRGERPPRVRSNAGVGHHTATKGGVAPLQRICWKRRERSGVGEYERSTVAHAREPKRACEKKESTQIHLLKKRGTTVAQRGSAAIGYGAPRRRKKDENRCGEWKRAPSKWVGGDV